MAFDVDMAELVDGYQFDGRSRAIARWREQKDAQSFEALCNRLRVSKWRREVHEEGGERLEALRKRQRDYIRRKRNEATRPVVVATCKAEGCSARWRVNPSQPGTRRVYCSRACERRTAYKRKHPNPGRHCSICGEKGHNRRTCPKRT